MNFNDLFLKNNVNKIDLLNFLNNEEKDKIYITRNPGGLNGIDKIIIINLKGSIREQHMRNQLNKINNLIEGDDYEFINPINFIIDNFDFETLFTDNFFIKNKLDQFLNEKNEYKKGTISLSLITYYLYLKAYLENKIFLIFEDNIEFERNFQSKYNLFYSRLPQKNWFCLDLHTTNNHGYHENYKKYYEELQSKINIKYIIPEVNNKDDNWRPILNKYVYLGTNEYGGAKGYIIKPLTFLFINNLPIIEAADNLKGTITAYGNVGITFVSKNSLIRYTDKYLNDRRNIDDNIITNEYIKLDQEKINNIIETVKKFDYYQYIEFEKIIYKMNIKSL